MSGRGKLSHVIHIHKCNKCINSNICLLKTDFMYLVQLTYFDFENTQHNSDTQSLHLLR